MIFFRFAPPGGWEAFYAKYGAEYEGYNYSSDEEGSEDAYDFDYVEDFGFDFDYYDVPFGFGYGYLFGFGFGYDHHGHVYHSP